MQNLSSVTKPACSLLAHARAAAAPRPHATRRAKNRAISRLESWNKEESTLVVVTLMFSISGMLPIWLIVGAFWLGWPTWLAEWLCL